MKNSLLILLFLFCLGCANQSQNQNIAQRDAAIAEVGEAAYRVWRLYMAACALEFEAGGSGIYQILASNRHPGKWPVPMTRRDLYRSRPHWDWGN